MYRETNVIYMNTCHNMDGCFMFFLSFAGEILICFLHAYHKKGGVRDFLPQYVNYIRDSTSSSIVSTLPMRSVSHGSTVNFFIFQFNVFSRHKANFRINQFSDSTLLINEEILWHNPFFCHRLNQGLLKASSGNSSISVLRSSSNFFGDREEHWTSRFLCLFSPPLK